MTETCGMTNYVFGDDLKFFVKHIPRLTDREEFGIQIENEKTAITTDEAVKASCEHDALHYLSQQPFNQEGEEYVAYLEKTFNRGWLPLGDKYNTFKPKECECSHITQELITQTAEKILMHTNARIKRHKREKIRQIEKRKLTMMYGK